VTLTRLTSTLLALALLAAVTAIAPARAHAQARITSCSTTGKNLFVRDTLTDLYYWYEFLPNLNPSRFDSPEAYLEAVRYRELDHSYSYITSRAANDAFFSESQFIGFGLSTKVTGDEMRVLQVFDGSPAAEAGLDRGHRIVEINGRAVSELIATGQIGSAFGRAEAGVVATVAFDTREGETKRATMTKRAVTIPTVSLTKVYDVDGRRVGYVFFRNFVRPSVDALDAAFASLREAGVTDLVLDLRYNGGGLVDVAVHLASLIGGTATNGRLLARYVHNAKNRADDEDLRFGAREHALGLARLFVITTQGSASASELLVSALRPYMPVTVVGDRTYGKPVGQYAIPFCDKVVAPVAFSIRNSADEGDYYSGIPADCPAADDVTHDLGHPDEASLAEALHAVRTGACSARAGVEGALRPQRVPADARDTGWQSVVNAW
jgi:carboxyl-terminal processing protease